MVGTRSIQTSGCSGAYLSSCHSQLSEGASWCLRPCQACPALGHAVKLSANSSLQVCFLCQNALGQSILASVFACSVRVLFPDQSCRKDLQIFLRDFKISRLSLPTAPPAKRPREQVLVELRRLVGRVDEREGSELERTPRSQPVTTPHPIAAP